MDLVTNSNFASGSELLSQHQAASIVGRNDINLLLSRKVERGEISVEMQHSFARDAAHRFNEDKLRKCAQGATCVSFPDMVAIHLFESSPEQTINVVDDRPRRNTRQHEDLWVNHLWSTRINILLTEDSTGYGTQFCSVPPFKRLHGVPTALTWTMFGILSSCPALWHAVDALPYFEWSGLEGWLLTAIQSICFSFETVRMDRRSPFKKLSLAKIVEKVNEYFEDDDVDMAGEEDQTPSEFYKFGFSHFSSLFGRQVYRNSVSVCSSIEGATEEELNAKVVIVVGDAPPEIESHCVHRH